MNVAGLPSECSLGSRSTMWVQHLREVAHTEWTLQANLGFPHYMETFDVVHARAVSAGVRSLSDASPASTH